MKILLVNAINYSNKIERVYPPLGLAYLASALKKKVINKYFIKHIVNNKYDFILVLREDKTI